MKAIIKKFLKYAFNSGYARALHHYSVDFELSKAINDASEGADDFAEHNINEVMIKLETND